MYSKLLHIYGPLYINSYGLAIAIGFLVFTAMLYKDTILQKLCSQSQLNTVLTWGIVSAFIGGRLLFALSSRQHIDNYWILIKPWEGGFSILGSILGVLCIIPVLLKKEHIPIIPFLDRLAIYGPLLQSISRIGCFFAGCCYGAQTSLPWAITYTNHDTLAPLNIALHPSQLYSSLMLGAIFLYMYFIIAKKARKPGYLLLWYLILVSSERFFIDFFRSDRIFSNIVSQVLSFHQWIALFICFIAGIIILTISIHKKTHEPV